MKQHPLSLVGVGCGGRTLTYCGLAARQPDRYRLIAGADPLARRVNKLAGMSQNPGFRAFASDAELFAAGRLADVAIIGTQDAYHVEPALRAMEVGYDVLLEKPIAPNPSDILKLEAAAIRLGRKVMVCHVLRYSPFYEKVKEILETGILGDIVSVDAREGVGAWHQSHSYVRGHWAVSGKATPMLIAKSCHDLDIIAWLVGCPCEEVSSFGSLQHFTAAHAPEGAPARCTDGCPVGDTCFYNALHYAGRQRVWLQWVMDGSDDAGEAEVAAWLKTSPWGRCVYRCDNDAVDHQVLAMRFAGGATATFTMTAFDSGRDITICGTCATLRGGESVKSQSGHDIIVQEHSGNTTRYGVRIEEGGYGGHGGADTGLVNALDREMRKPMGEMRSGLPASIESHLIGYAAEESRHSGQTVNLAGFREKMREGNQRL
jgi:predicted dehydrogenase